MIKFDGFKDNDEIIINPEFGWSLKASLKASKRRLMLFIDNNEEINLPKEKSKFFSNEIWKIEQLKGNSNIFIYSTGKQNILSKPKQQKKSSSRYNQKPKTEMKNGQRFSLGLHKEDIEYSIDGYYDWENNLSREDRTSNEDMVLWEFEPLPNYFQNRKTVQNKT